MELSVIILNYNVKHFLAICIESVQKAIKNLSAEIIVVDNASTDGSKEMVTALYPEVTYIYLDKNEGFPKGNNIGVQHAKGTYICILNPDTIVSEDTFTNLLAEYKNKKNVGIFGTELIDGAGNFLPESKRGVPTPWVAFTKVLGLYKLFPSSKWFNQYYAQHLNSNQSGEVAILVGAFMLLEKNLYEKVGGFDEGCFMYSDDIDLSYLVLKEGKQNYYIPNTTVIHFKGESTLKDGLFMKRFKDAMQFFYNKHFKKSILFDFLMSIGIFLFAFKKKNTKPKIKIKANQYHLVTTNSNLIDKVKNQLTNVVVTDEIPLNNPLKTSDRVEFLVDSETISFKQYINFLKEHTNSNYTYKIKPSKLDIFIGSNDKDDKGEILLLN